MRQAFDRALAYIPSVVTICLVCWSLWHYPKCLIVAAATAKVPALPAALLHLKNEKDRINGCHRPTISVKPHLVPSVALAPADVKRWGAPRLQPSPLSQLPCPLWQAFGYLDRAAKSVVQKDYEAMEAASHRLQVRRTPPTHLP